MTSVNIEVASADLSKKPQKQAWYDRRWPIFSSRKVSKQNSKKRKEQLANNSEVLSTTSHDSAKTSNQSRGSVSSHTDPTCAHKDTASLNSASTDSDSLVECLLCLTSQPADEYPILTTCQHQTCLSCLRQYLQVEISESRVNLTCPACQEKFHPSDVISILQDNGDLLLKWEEFLLRRTLSIDPDCRWCPAPDCGYAVIAYGCASCPRLECKRPGCNTEFCYHCRQEWHHNQTCDSAHLQRTKQLRIRTDSGAYSQGSSGNDDIKPCPKCGAFIVKMNDGSCNHMTCTVCDAEFCWLCLQEITDLHYLSPSGCTFWGKKPWSKKKKIIWQLGLLIGAPLGIALVAGVAVPAIMIGLPVWIGKKVVNKLRKANASKHQKNLAAVGAVSASILISPALAGVAVAIGVPVLLLYVYGVVPISLYRTGSGTGGKGQPMASNVAAMIPGLRFDISSSALATRPMSQEEGSNFQPRSNQSAMVTPSIGEGSVGGVTMGSLNISHASNLDKLARGDQDGASTVAMAGTSITGSISGVSSGFNPPMRNEIQVKDTDQHSIQTHMSACSNTAGITSVQIHVTDDVSLHSSTSMRGNVKRTYSSKRSLNRNTARQNKGSSFPSTSSAKASEEQSGLEPAVSIQESNCVLTIVDESPYSSRLDNTTLHESHITIESDQSNCITTEAKSELPTGSAESSRFSSL